MRTLLAVSLIILILDFTYLVYAPKTEDKTYTNEVQSTESGRPLPVAPGPASDPVPGVSAESPDTYMNPNKGIVRSINLGQIEDFDEALEKLQTIGMGDISKHSRTWREKRGFAPQDGDGSLLLGQPYKDMNDETLLLNAENGDMWAQQIYAERIESTHPADAISWYTAAAQNGSIYAMKKLETLYSKLAGARSNPLNLTETYKQQRADLLTSPDTPEQVSTAWAVVAQMAGADPGKNAALKSRMEQDLSADGLSRVCLIAGTLYSNLSEARITNNQGDFNRAAPPYTSGSVQELSKIPCADIYAGSKHTGPDFSACNEIELVSNGEVERAVLCNQQQN